MKFIKTIHWLFTEAPTNITDKIPAGTKCDYCGTEEELINLEGVVCICKHCLKRVADITLKGSA